MASVFPARTAPGPPSVQPRGPDPLFPARPGDPAGHRRFDPNEVRTRPAGLDPGDGSGGEPDVGDVLVLAPLAAEVDDLVHPRLVQPTIVTGRPRGHDAVPAAHVEGAELQAPERGECLRLPPQTACSEAGDMIEA